MDNLRDHNLIEKYFDKELSKSALVKFKKRMETDRAFAGAFKLRQELEVAFQFEEKPKRLKKTMRRVEHKLLFEKKDKRLALYKSLAIAASTLFLVGCAFATVQFRQIKEKEAQYDQSREKALSDSSAIATLNFDKEALQKSIQEHQQLLDSTKQANEKQRLAYSQLKNELWKANHTISKLQVTNEQYEEKIENLNAENNEIFKQHENLKIFINLDKLYVVVDTCIVEPILLDILPERGNRDIDSLIKVAREKHNNADYKGAIIDFEVIRQTNGEDDELLFYEGMCYLSEGREGYQKAILIFEKLLAKEHIEEDELLWRLALLYLRTGAFEKAKVKLEKIVEMEKPQHKKRKEAERLLAYYNN